jgi:hypothetical protein
LELIVLERFWKMTDSVSNITAVFIPEHYEQPIKEIQLSSSTDFRGYLNNDIFITIHFRSLTITIWWCSVLEALNLYSEDELDVEGLYGREGPSICYKRHIQFSPKRWENERASDLAGFKVYGDVVLVDVSRHNTSTSSNKSNTNETTNTNNTTILLRALTLNDYTKFSQTKNLLRFLSFSFSHFSSSVPSRFRFLCQFFILYSLLRTSLMNELLNL